jgi:hypothetical protein
LSIPEYVHALYVDYLHLVASDPRSLTEDETRSILYFRTEQSLAAGGTNADDIPRRVLKWITSARAVDDFIAAVGRLPRENNRLPRAHVSAEERVLVEWLRYQRRPRTRETHCDYQRRRLEAVPGFLWEPIADRWSDTFRDYERFLVRHRRAPSIRSVDPLERHLAAWASKQRHRRRRRHLDAARESALATLPIWSWGAR